MEKEYFRPSVTVDSIIFTIRDSQAENYRKLPKKELQILLIKRAQEPFKDKWSLPGTFVGEKEKHTLETLLYCPLSVKQIFQAKVLASFLFSMMVALISFAAMMIVLEMEAIFIMDMLIVPAAGWIVILCLLSPSISLITVTLIVRGSAKAQSVEESQQGAVFLIVPLILLVAGQFAGVMLLNVWILLGLGVLCALLAWVLLQKAVGRFTYEMLLK